MISELPAFIWHLIHWEIPAELKSDRFGVKHYHHPDLLAAIDAMAPEVRLLEIIDMQMSWCGEPSPDRTDKWSGTAVSLQSLLLQSSLVGYEARQLLSWPNAAGTYLGRLARNRPDRVKGDRSSDQRAWDILPPKGYGGIAPLTSLNNKNKT